jgi:hypothetical protein
MESAVNIPDAILDNSINPIAVTINISPSSTHHNSPLNEVGI